jgi:hypothetical protein
VSWTIVVLSPWGEYEMTQETLAKAEEIVNRAEADLGQFCVEKSR